MFVVPLEKDTIETVDGQSYKVVSYTNYKESGPAVYVRTKEDKTPVLVYFFDISSINGTRVEYSKGSKILKSLGRVKRIYDLPQIDDKVTVTTNKISTNDINEEERFTVVGIKLKSKSLGISKGLMIKCDNGNYYRLNQILDIDRSLGSDNYNRSEFLEYYKEYTGI